MNTRTRKPISLLTLTAVVLAASTALAASTKERAERSERAQVKPETIVVEPRVGPPRIVPPRQPDYGFDVDIWTAQRTYEVGDLVRVYFRVTRPCYVYIFNTDTRGVTNQLFPNYYDPDNYVVPGRRYFIPDANYRLRVAGPPGTEELRIVAVRYRARLFERRHRWTPQAPFPIYPEGTKGFLREYQREEKREERRVRQPEAGPRHEVERDREAVREGGRERTREVAGARPETIVVEPRRPRSVVIEKPDVRYDREWAEASTTIRVHDPYWRPAPAQYGRLEVSSRPLGARVYIDNRYVGRTPMTLRSLDPGYHSITVSMPGFSTWAEDVRVREGRTVVVNVTLRPNRPRIFFDFRF